MSSASAASPSRPLKRSPSPATGPSRPAKLPRTAPASMSPLRRTETYASFSSFCAPAAITPPPPVPLPPVTTTTTVPQPSPASSAFGGSQSIPYTRTLHYYKEQREQRKALIRDGTPPEHDPLFLLIASTLFSHHTQPQQQQQIQPSIHPPTPTGSPSRGIRSTRLKPPHQQFPAKPKRKQRNSVPRFRPAFTPVSSPLAPRPYTPSTLYNMRSKSSSECRLLIPRSKPAPDLYRVAVKACARQCRTGQQLVSLGPRLARKVGDASRELRRHDDVENAPLSPLEIEQRPGLKPRRPLVRTESIADLSPFICPPSVASMASVVSPEHDVDMDELDFERECFVDLDQEDWVMLDCS